MTLSLKATKPSWCPITLVLRFKLTPQSIFKLESGNQNVLDEYTPQMGQQRGSNFRIDQKKASKQNFNMAAIVFPNGTNFESNQA